MTDAASILRTSDAAPCVLSECRSLSRSSCTTMRDNLQISILVSPYNQTHPPSVQTDAISAATPLCFMLGHSKRRRTNVAWDQAVSHSGQVELSQSFLTTSSAVRNSRLRSA